MQNVKTASTHKRSRMTKFQMIVISLLLLFLFCDVFIIKHIPFSINNAVMVNFFYILQIVLSGVCMEQVYPSLCLRMRKFRQTSVETKTQFPLYLYQLHFLSVHYILLNFVLWQIRHFSRMDIMHLIILLSQLRL
mgnify:CR=1 FL=1